MKTIAKQWGKNTKWLARYADHCAIPHAKHPFRA